MTVQINGISLQKHQIKGPVGYTVVGSPTIADGVASGFNNDNFLTLPSADLSQPFEIFLKIKTPATWGTDYGCIIGSNSSTSSKFVIQKDGSTKRIMYRIPSFNEEVYANYFSSTLLENTIYYIRVVYNGQNIKMEHSTDNNTWETDATETRQNGLPNRAYALGRNYALAQQAWPGTIDLNETYIKVNGKLWYWQPQETKKIIVNGVTVFELNPPVQQATFYSATGSQYVYLNNSIDFNSANTWEINTRITPTGDTDGRIFSQYDNSSSGYLGQYPIVGLVNRKLYLWLSSDGVPTSGSRTFDIASEGPSSFTMNTGTPYDVSLVFTGTQYLLKCKEATSSSWGSPIFTVTSSTHVYSGNGLMEFCNQGQDGQVTPLRAYLNMTATNIKLDGVTVFNGATAVEGVDYTNSGCTETITDGTPVYTTTGYNQFLKIDNFIDLHSADTWEIDCHVKTPSTLADSRVFSCALYDYTTPVLALNPSVGSALFLSSTGSSWDIAGYAAGGSFASDTEYYFKVYYTGSAYKFDYKTPTGDWTNASTVNQSAKQYADSNISRFSFLASGWVSGSGSAPFKGLLYFNELKIKLNGTTVFDGSTATEGVDFTNTGCTLLI